METRRPPWVIALAHEYFRLLLRREHNTPRGQQLQRRVCRWHCQSRRHFNEKPTYIICPGDPPPIDRRRRGTFEGSLAREPQ